MSKLNEVVELLKNNELVSGYICNENNTDRYELYYVLDKLETTREVATKSIDVTVYRDFEEYRGSSNFSVFENMTTEEIKQKIDEALQRSLFAKNKYFELPKKPENYEYQTISSNIENMSISDVAYIVSKAIFKANVYKEGWINSTEVFVSKTKNHFINSNGVDVKYQKCRIFLEVIPTWSGAKEEVELYFSSNTSELDENYIFTEVDNILLLAKNRSEAKPIDASISKCKVILLDKDIENILDCFVSKTNYSKQYRKMSQYNVGDDLNNKFDVTLIPTLKGSISSNIIDAYGTALKETKVIENGKYINMHGNCKDAYYMGIKNPTGTISNMKVEPSYCQSYEEMTSDKYILALSFSAFQVDDFSGFFGGEIRLAMYFDGSKLIPVTGFSISGNIYEDIPKMVFSKELSTITGYLGPKYLAVEMTVTN